MFSLFRVLILLAVFAWAGCSSSIFTGDKDSELESLKGDGRFNKLCLGLNFSSETLDVATARSLLKCLNSNDSIHEYAVLVEKLSDNQLQVILDVVNEQLLTNHKRLKEVDRSFQQMDERGIVDRAFMKLSKVLSKGKFIRSAIRLVRQGTSTPSSADLDPSILKSIRILGEELQKRGDQEPSKKLARKNAERALELGLTTSRLKAYKSIIEGLNSANILLRVPGQGLEYFTDRLLEYVKAKIRSKDVYAKTVLWGIEDGSLLKAFDHYYTGQCESESPAKCHDQPKLGTDEQVQAMEAFMQVLTVHQKEEILKPMVELFRAMDAPIECMAGSKQVPNADMFVMNEILSLKPLEVPQWLIRTNSMKIKLVNSMCQFPKGTNGESFNSLMSVLRALADYREQNEAGQIVSRRPLITVAHFLRALQFGDKIPMGQDARTDLSSAMNYPESERYRRFMIHFLGDKDTQINVYSHLADAIGEIARKERSVLGNALYLLNSTEPDSEDRADLQSAVRVLLKLREDLKVSPAASVAEELPPGSNPTQARSIYDVFSNSLLNVDKATVVELLTGVSEFIDENEEFVVPLLEVSRDALLMNDVNPTLDIIIDLAAQAETKKQLFKTLFDIADTKEFEDAMRLTSKMASNGSLKELIHGTLTLFHNTIDKVPGVPNLVNVPAYKQPDPARDKSTAGRKPWLPIAGAWPEDSTGVRGCYDLNFDLPFSHSRNSMWRPQVESLAACVNANRNNKELSDFIQYGLEEKIRGDQSVFSYLVELASDLIPTDSTVGRLKNIYDELSDLMTDFDSFKDLKDVNSILPFIFGKKYSVTSDESLSVFQSIARATSVLEGEDLKVEKILGLGQEVIKSSQMPKSLALLYDVYQDGKNNSKPIESADHPPLVSYPINVYPENSKLQQMIDDAIYTFEKRQPTERIRKEKVDAYFKQSLPGYDIQGFKNSAELKANIKPFLDELSKDSRLEWTLAFFFYFDDKPYSPEWFSQWFKKLSAHVTPIPYYYPGQDPNKVLPTVRLVSQLDLLELVVLEADFSLKDVEELWIGGAFKGIRDLKDLFKGFESGNNQNTAIKYLTKLALSGENLTPVMDEMGRELAFFHSLVDSPLNSLSVKLTGKGVLKPETQRRLFNLKYIFPLFREMNRMQEYTLSDGRKLVVNDLWVLRDLFKTILQATPGSFDIRKNKDLYRRDLNSLAVIAGMVQTGALRNVGPNIWSLNESQDFRIPVSADDGDPAHRQIVPGQLSHVFRTLKNAAVIKKGDSYFLNSETVSLLSFLVRENCDRSLPEYRNGCLAGSNENFDTRYVLIGKLLDQYFEWIKDDDARARRGEQKVAPLLKNFGYNATLLLDKLGKSPQEKLEITQSIVRSGLPLIASQKGSNLIGDNLDELNSLVTKTKFGYMLQYLVDSEFSYKKRPHADYEDREAFEDFRGLSTRVLHKLAAQKADLSSTVVDLAWKFYKDPQRRFRVAKNTIDALLDDREFMDFQDTVLDRVTGNLIHWFPKEPTSDRSRDLRPRLQEYLGEHLGNGDIQDLINFIIRESSGAQQDQLYNQMKFLGDAEYVNKLNDFLDLMKSGIVDIYQVPKSQHVKINATRAMN